MKIDTDDFQIKPGEKVNLKDRPTDIDPLCSSKEEYKQELQKHAKELENIHELLYASDKYAMLLILQGMDTAGKDGAIRHVLSGVNPQGCEVTSFKEPSKEELLHDFMWRSTVHLPARGKIGIFNRSYYEEVLVVRVHPELLEGEGLADDLREIAELWKQRYRAINELERHLYYSDTRIVKVFLHLSKSEQKKRFLARIDKPDKNWKLSMADIHERKYWKEYMQAYETCMEATSTELAPWYAVPADDKDNARLIVSQILLDQMGALKMTFPKSSPERRRELKEIRKALAK